MTIYGSDLMTYLSTENDTGLMTHLSTENDNVLMTYIVRPTRLYSSVPQLETGTPKLFGVAQKRINHSRVAFNTRPTECPTRPRRMIDASRVYTFI